jgi:GT2 family glycosyltransferase
LIATAFADAPDLAAVIGSYDDAPTAKNFLSQYKNLFHHYVHQHSQEHASTFWGACGAIRKDAFLALGGFAESYWQPSIEDIELGYRLTRAGGKIRLLKEVQVTHLKRWGAYSLLKTDIVYRALPWTDLIWRSGSVPDDLNLRWTNRASTLLVYAYAVLLLVSGRSPLLLGLARSALLLLLALNCSLYRFFWRKRGGWFAIRALLWHWFYYGYSGLAFGVGTVMFLTRNRRALPVSSATLTERVVNRAPSSEWRT